MWPDLKRLLSRIYVSVKSYNFIYFLKESEWRKKTEFLNNYQKLNEIMFLFNHTAETLEFNLYDKNELFNYNKDEYDISDENNSSSENDSDEI